MTLKLVIFDCDGTLHNSVGGVELGLYHAFAKNNLPKPDLTGLGRRLARPMYDVIGTVLDRDTPDGVGKSVLSDYENYMDGKPIGSLYDGVMDVLAELQSRGYLMAMVTGMGGRGVVNLLDTYPIKQYFDAVKHADNAPSKPSPQSLYDIMSELGIDCADNIVMIGDTVTDMDYARAGGVASIGVAWGYETIDTLKSRGGATHIAHQVHDVLDIIETCIGKTQ